MVDKSMPFENKLEIQWAMFFKTCHTEYEYIPRTSNKYIPNFRLIKFWGEEDLFVNVEPHMTTEYGKRIIEFTRHSEEDSSISNPTLMLYSFPVNEYLVGMATIDPKGTMEDVTDDILWNAEKYAREKYQYPEYEYPPEEYNFELINGDYYGLVPGIDKKTRKLDLFGADTNYLLDMDYTRTIQAYQRAWYLARNYIKRFGIC